MLVKKYS